MLNLKKPLTGIVPPEWINHPFKKAEIKQLNICIDIDGTVTDPYYWLEKANWYFNMSVKPDEVTQYDIHKVMEIEEDDYLEFYNLYGNAMHRDAKVRFGVSQIIQKLYPNHKIHIVTAREDKLERTSIEWFAKHDIPIDTIAHLGTHYKVDKAIELESDVFIEDSYNNAMQLSAAGFEVLLIDCTYNRGALPTNVTRVKNWFEIYQIVLSLSHNHGSQQEKLLV